MVCKKFKKHLNFNDAYWLQLKIQMLNAACCHIRT